MNGEHIIDAMGDLPEDVIRSVDALRKPKKQRPVWLKWGALAACLCVVLALTVPLLHREPQTPSLDEIPADSGENDRPDTAIDDHTPDGWRPYFIVDGKTYDTTPHSSAEESLPEGFVYAGQLENGNDYYTNPDMPEWIYVFQLHRVDYRRDYETGEMVADHKYGYVRWVDVRLAGRELLYYKGEYYISLNSAKYKEYESNPDITEGYYDEMVRIYGGTRVEGEPKYGAELIGQTVFAGFDTVPEGDLACNVAVRNVYKTGVTGMLLVSNAWTEGKKVCRGYDVYVRYDCPFAEPGGE